MRFFSIPNLLSSSRYLLAMLTTAAVLSNYWLMAMVAFATAVITDLVDGYLARRNNQVTALGGLLDHSADATFVVLSLAGLAHLSMISWILPPLILLAFVQYTIDSNAHKGLPLRASFLGRYNGIAYFILSGWLIFQTGLNLPLIPPALLYNASWVLALTTAISMADRLIARYR